MGTSNSNLVNSFEHKCTVFMHYLETHNSSSGGIPNWLLYTHLSVSDFNIICAPLIN